MSERATELSFGPLRVSAQWLSDADGYRQAVCAAAAEVLARPAHGASEYVPKASGELEPMLALWPHVLVLPCRDKLTPEQLLLARAWPVHPLGVVERPTWADGRLCSPAEFFFHDLDHARFKVREDLLARGLAIDDAYRDGSTFDASRGEHRRILGEAAPLVSAELWHGGAARQARVAGWLAAIAAEPHTALAQAAFWLLFELLHEKSLPIDAAVLGKALAGDAHVAKLTAKCRAGFYRASGPSDAAVALLPQAKDWLARRIAQEAGT